jgi:hypothetical protein
MSLLGCLEDGVRAKRVVDRVLEASKFFVYFWLRGRAQTIILTNFLSLFSPLFSFFPSFTDDHVVNLRESILIHRLKYTLATSFSMSGSSDEAASASVNAEAHLTRAGNALEKYFFMIAFASFVETSETTRGKTSEESFEYKQSFSEWLMARPEIWK